MATKTPKIERVGASIHVSLLGGSSGQRIEAYLSYHTEWRGEPAAVTMQGDRYTVHSVSDQCDRLTDWRVHCQEARSGWYRCDAAPDGKLGHHLTETARRRLGDACRPDAVAWLASEEAAERLRRAYFSAAVRDLTGTTPHPPHTRDRGAQLLDRWGEHMGEEHAGRFRVLVDAWETWNEYVRVAREAG